MKGLPIMPNTYVRLMDPTPLAANAKSSRTEVADLGAETKARAQIRVIKAGSAGTIRLQEAAVNEDGAFVDIANSTVSLGTTSNTIVPISDFLRFIRWITDGDVAGNPVVIIDIIGKH